MEALVVGAGEVVVALDGQLVLRLARDAPLLGGDGHVVTHGQAGAGLGVRRRGDAEVGGADLGEGEGLVLGALRAVGLEQLLAQRLADGDRGVRGGVDAAGHAGLDLAELDLVGHEDRGLEAGAAGLLEVVGRGGRGEGRAQDRLTGEVEVARVLDDRSADDLVEVLAAEVVAGDEPVQGGREHVLVGRLGVRAELAGEGDAVATEDGGATRQVVSHHRSPGRESE